MTGPRMGARLRRPARVLAMAVLVAAAAAGLWAAARSGPAGGSQARVTEVASGLRCPSCAGQSVAASESDLARQMRQITAEQLAAGRTPDQIRAWFADRYGPGVLLDPPMSGAGLLARVLPFALLVVGGLVVARRLRGRRGLLAGAGVACGLGAVLVAAGGLSDGRPSGTAAVAAQVWAPAASSASSGPTSSSTGVGSAPSTSRLALTALQQGRVADAEQLARRALTAAPQGSQDWQDALLVLGLTQRQRDDPAAAQTLLRFLQAAPDHPAAAMVRRLLDGR